MSKQREREIRERLEDLKLNSLARQADIEVTNRVPSHNRPRLNARRMRLSSENYRQRKPQNWMQTEKNPARI